MTASLRLVDINNAAQWSEEEIKELSASNRRLAMDMAVRKYRDRLYWHAMGILKDSEEAHDYVQEVFIRAIREPRFFDAEFRMKAWLFRVTTNLCFNNVRDRRRRAAILENNPMTEAVLGDQLDRVLGGQRKADILMAIDKMTEDHREILLLRYYSDLSYAEIAEVLDIKLGTVMSRLSRARSRLLEAMGIDEAQAHL
jgi:RNA polymerase sigma-70 factor (ECF subfamily)